MISLEEYDEESDLKIRDSLRRQLPDLIVPDQLINEDYIKVHRDRERREYITAKKIIFKVASKIWPRPCTIVQGISSKIARREFSIVITFSDTYTCSYVV